MQTFEVVCQEGAVFNDDENGRPRDLIKIEMLATRCFQADVVLLLRKIKTVCETGTPL